MCPMLRKGLECPVSKLVDSETCPRPMAGAAPERPNPYISLVVMSAYECGRRESNIQAYINHRTIARQMEALGEDGLEKVLRHADQERSLSFLCWCSSPTCALLTTPCLCIRCTTAGCPSRPRSCGRCR